METFQSRLETACKTLTELARAEGYVIVVTASPMYSYEVTLTKTGYVAKPAQDEAPFPDGLPYTQANS
jgi:hypothetical protein